MGPLQAPHCSKVTHDPPGKPEHPAISRQVDQLDLPTLPRFETHGSAGRDVQAHAATGRTVEGERVVGFKKW